MNVGRLFILELQEIYSLRYTFNCPSVEYPEEPPLNCISCLSSWSDQIHCLDHLLTEKSSVESKSNYALEQSQSVPLTRDYLTIQIRSVAQFGAMLLHSWATPRESSFTSSSLLAQQIYSQSGDLLWSFTYPSPGEHALHHHRPMIRMCIVINIFIVIKEQHNDFLTIPPPTTARPKE